MNTAALLRGRAAAEALMVDTCTIRRKTGETTDPDTGVITPTLTTIYTGKCRIQQQSGIARPADVGQANVFLSRLELQIPMAVTGVDSDDEAVIDTSVNDPDLVGRVFHVRELAHKTHATARRFQVDEVTS